MKELDIVQVTSIRDNRFDKEEARHERLPAVGDTGTIVYVYSDAFEVECVGADGAPIWLETMYADELAPHGHG